ncbi:MAG: hypothetical protein AB7E65_09580, partial [Syntrophotalea sp.]|uniref:hypothetical protein n=1 Tax=Syntrophotalea sp. TaxID=2812029 RepID=UPI003D0A9088
VAAWEDHRNSSTKKINWQFTTADARIKLTRLYPKLQLLQGTRSEKPECPDSGFFVLKFLTASFWESLRMRHIDVE